MSASDGFPALEPILRAEHAIADDVVGRASVMVASARGIVGGAVRALAADPALLLCRHSACGFCPVARATTGPSPNAPLAR